MMLFFVEMRLLFGGGRQNTRHKKSKTNKFYSVDEFHKLCKTFLTQTFSHLSNFKYKNQFTTHTHVIAERKTFWQLVCDVK
jgi:hypothetical protein